ncbi:MAG: hypothetical protein CL952_00340 [Erythrobacteraceae bacterium]|nr:hypothetical protein [Erythrobacteraceae bacterium]
MADEYKDAWARDAGGRRWATGVIRAHMVKRGISYADLAERLALVGIEENERNLRNKVARGTFSAAFLAECLTAIGVRHLEIDIVDLLMGTREAVAFERTIERLNAGLSLTEARVDPSGEEDWLLAQIKERRVKKFPDYG